MGSRWEGDSYRAFASVYDMFMDNIPYGEWCSYLAGLLQEYGIGTGLVADLGCGTGSITEGLAERGYDMIGIDNSEEMLSVAMSRNPGTILYLLQDMREFELYGTVDAVVSICDSMNYLMEEEDLLTVFQLVNNYLEQDGIFIFDLNTEYKYRSILAENTIAENREDASFIWENYYYEEEKVNEYDLTIYIRESDNRYQRFTETHYQRAYPLSKIKELLLKAGMEFIGAYEAFTREPPKKDSERIYVVAKEGFQEKKQYRKGK